MRPRHQNQHFLVVERITHTTAMNSSPRNPTPMREEELDRFRDSKEILDKFLKCLFGVIALKTTATGEALFKAHPNVMTVITLMTVLHFLLWLLGTMLPQRNVIFLMISVSVILVIGSVSSVLVLTLISLHIAWLNSLLWFGIFALTAYYCYQELYKFFVCAISDIIKKLIENSKRQGTRLPV